MPNKNTQPKNNQKEEKTAPISNGKVILVIEDDTFYGNIFKTKLTKEGYDVTIATNGKKGLEAAAEKKPALILLDLVMPIMDGFETLEHLKADENLKNIKVVVLSNLGQESDVEKAKQLGAEDYLIKSNISIQAVVEMVKKLVG